MALNLLTGETRTRVGDLFKSTLQPSLDERAIIQKELDFVLSELTEGAGKTVGFEAVMETPSDFLLLIESSAAKLEKILKEEGLLNWVHAKNILRFCAIVRLTGKI
jgi:hypothetical protein